jgi:hypothetical protein
MKNIYQILHKCILIILAVQLLNMSFNNLNNFFDAQSPLSLEYFTEHLLGWDNYIPENKARTDHQANHLHKTNNHCWYAEAIIQPVTPINHSSGRNYPVTLCFVTSGYIGDINPPPPKSI